MQEIIVDRSNHYLMSFEFHIPIFMVGQQNKFLRSRLLHTFHQTILYSLIALFYVFGSPNCTILHFSKIRCGTVPGLFNLMTNAPYTTYGWKKSAPRTFPMAKCSAEIVDPRGTFCKPISVGIRGRWLISREKMFHCYITAVIFH